MFHQQATKFETVVNLRETCSNGAHASIVGVGAVVDNSVLAGGQRRSMCWLTVMEGPWVYELADLLSGKMKCKTNRSIEARPPGAGVFLIPLCNCSPHHCGATRTTYIEHLILLPCSMMRAEYTVIQTVRNVRSVAEV